MLYHSKKWLSLSLAVVLSATTVQPALAGVSYMPGVTAEMSKASFWEDYHEGYKDIILTPEEIKAFNQDTALAEGTMVMDLKTASETYNGISKNTALRTSSASDAQYYLSWTYDENGKKTDWAYFQEMIDNTQDGNAKEVMPVRYGVAVNRTIVQVFPSDKFLLDDPNDKDSDNMALSAVPVNEPVLIYATSADGKYYQVRIASCSGWIPAKDVAICADKEEWLSAWDLPSEDLLVVYGNKVYTDRSYETPNTSRRMLTTGAALELVTDLEADQRVGNRSPYHNYVVYLPVRNEDGSYSKELALIPETAKVHMGYLPLTMENIAMVSLNQLGDAYGWGGMLDVEDCSGMVRTVYSCFGLEVARNGNWQWNMNVEKIDVTNMSLEEKCLVLDQLPFGSALSFPGHQMMYLGKVNGKYYVLSTVSSVVSPDSGKTLRTRDVMINTLDVKRANGKSWLGALNRIFMLYYPTDTAKQFDVPPFAWYHDGVTHCMENGLMTGDINGAFGIGNPASGKDLAQALRLMIKGATPETAGQEYETLPSITREQAVTALWKFEQTQNQKADVAVCDITVFPDAAMLEGDVYQAAEWAYSAGITAGTGNGSLALDQPITREQLAIMLYRYSLLPTEV